MALGLVLVLVGHRCQLVQLLRNHRLWMFAFVNYLALGVLHHFQRDLVVRLLGSTLHQTPKLSRRHVAFYLQRLVAINLGLGQLWFVDFLTAPLDSLVAPRAASLPAYLLATGMSAGLQLPASYIIVHALAKGVVLLRSVAVLVLHPGQLSVRDVGILLERVAVHSGLVSTDVEVTVQGV